MKKIFGIILVGLIEVSIFAQNNEFDRKTF